jgi:hypothetical protein
MSITLSAKEKIENLAKFYNIVYSKTYSDLWAETITQLSDDEIFPDFTEDLLVELFRRKIITQNEMVKFFTNYLKEKNSLK